MRKLFLYVLLPVLLCVSFALIAFSFLSVDVSADNVKANVVKVKEYREADVQKCVKNLTCDLANKPITGVLKLYAEDGKLLAKETFKDGKLNGLKQQYNKSGSLRSEVSYIDGKKDGVEKFYDSAGTLRMEVPYVNGKKDGIQKKYAKNGSFTEVVYKNGKKVEDVKKTSEMKVENKKDTGAKVKTEPRKIKK